MSADPEVTREIGPRAFVLQRNEDETGVSGTGIVAEGVEFSDGTVALRWTSAWPTSVVFHDRGIDSVVHVHGHGGKTQVVFDDSATELRKLRRALVYWNYDHHTSDMLRDRIADVLERNADAIAAVEDPHDELLLAAADEIDRWNTEATAVIAGCHYLLGAVARWLAEGLGYPFDIETTIPLHPYMREYVEEAWVVLEGEHGDDLESAIRRNVAQAGGWAS